ncbi:MAG: hypothetical protein GY696_09455, partial [Gammaproteobacteria bacterium]|nr:hypothetical protein [Gammaproteobacteria bacterium]
MTESTNTAVSASGDKLKTKGIIELSLGFNDYDVTPKKTGPSGGQLVFAQQFEAIDEKSQENVILGRDFSHKFAWYCVNHVEAMIHLCYKHDAEKACSIYIKYPGGPFPLQRTTQKGLCELAAEEFSSVTIHLPLVRCDRRIGNVHVQKDVTVPAYTIMNIPCNIAQYGISSSVVYQPSAHIAKQYRVIHPPQFIHADKVRKATERSTFQIVIENKRQTPITLKKGLLIGNVLPVLQVNTISVPEKSIIKEQPELTHDSDAYSTDTSEYGLEPLTDDSDDEDIIASTYADIPRGQEFNTLRRPMRPGQFRTPIIVRDSTASTSSAENITRGGTSNAPPSANVQSCIRHVEAATEIGLPR